MSVRVGANRPAPHVMRTSPSCSQPPLSPNGPYFLLYPPPLTLRAQRPLARCHRRYAPG